jgi:hypothetical protein
MNRLVLTLWMALRNAFVPTDDLPPPTAPNAQPYRPRRRPDVDTVYPCHRLLPATAHA